MTSIDRAVEDYRALIVYIGSTTGLRDDILHIHAGLVVFMLAYAVRHRSESSWFPLAAVIATAVANEALDYFHARVIMPDTWSDLANTLFWPIVLTIAFRASRSRKFTLPSEAARNETKSDY